MFLALGFSLTTAVAASQLYIVCVSPIDLTNSIWRSKTALVALIAKKKIICVYSWFHITRYLMEKRSFNPVTSKRQKTGSVTRTFKQTAVA